MKKRVAVAFTGPSNSGKTTLIEKVAKELIKNYQVAIIKNDPKDKAQFDIKGKDSYIFYTDWGRSGCYVSDKNYLFFPKRKKLR